MANDISSNPWRIDTTPFSYTQRVRISNLNITDTAINDNIVINDANGKTIVDFTATSGDQSYRVGNIGWVNGVVVSALGDGNVITISIGAGK